MSTGPKNAAVIWVLDDDMVVCDAFSNFLATDKDLAVSTFTSPAALQAALQAALIQATDSAPPRQKPHVITLDISLAEDSLFMEPELLLLLGLSPAVKLIISGSVTDDCDSRLEIQAESAYRHPEKFGALVVYDVLLKTLPANIILQKIKSAAKFYQVQFFERAFGRIDGNLLVNDLGEVQLSATEAKFLKVFSCIGSDSATREELEGLVWPNEKVGHNTLDSMLTRLRTKLRPIGLDVETVAGTCLLFHKRRVV